MFIFGVILVSIFPHSDWIRRGANYLIVFSSNAGKCEPEYLRMRTLFTQCFSFFNAWDYNIRIIIPCLHVWWYLFIWFFLKKKFMSSKIFQNNFLLLLSIGNFLFSDQSLFTIQWISKKKHRINFQRIKCLLNFFKTAQFLRYIVLKIF